MMIITINVLCFMLATKKKTFLYKVLSFCAPWYLMPFAIIPQNVIFYLTWPISSIWLANADHMFQTVCVWVWRVGMRTGPWMTRVKRRMQRHDMSLKAASYLYIFPWDRGGFLFMWYRNVCGHFTNTSFIEVKHIELTARGEHGHGFSIHWQSCWSNRYLLRV